MYLSERIKMLAPANAVHYRLVALLHDGNSRLFPTEPGGFYRVGESPYGVSTGGYTLCFFDEHYRPLPHHDQPFLVNLQNEVHRSNQAQLSLHFTNANAAAASPTTNSLPPQTTQPPSPATQVTAMGGPPIDAQTSRAMPRDALTGRLEESDLEYQKYLHAMDIEERQQEFIKNSTYITEVGEIFTLNRIMRRELMELQRVILLNAQQAYKDASLVKSTIHELVHIQKEVLESAAAQIGRPPPPPPDYVGLGHSALAMIRDIGVALINRSQTRESLSPLTGKTATPQLMAHSENTGISPKTQPADIIDRMVDKLKNTTDLEIAMNLSSPENWKALIDELSHSPKEQTTKNNSPVKSDNQTDAK